MFIKQEEDRVELADGWSAYLRRHWTAGDQEDMMLFIAGNSDSGDRLSLNSKEDRVGVLRFRWWALETVVIRFEGPDGISVEATSERFRELRDDVKERLMDEAISRIPLGGERATAGEDSENGSKTSPPSETASSDEVSESQGIG